MPADQGMSHWAEITYMKLRLDFLPQVSLVEACLVSEVTDSIPIILKKDIESHSMDVPGL